MSIRKFQLMAVILLTGVPLLYQTSIAWGFAFIPNTNFGTGYPDLINDPNNYYSWDAGTITYSFDSSFTSNQAIRDQIRLGFRQ